MGQPAMSGAAVIDASTRTPAANPSEPFQQDELDVWAGFLRTHSRITRHLSTELERGHGLTVREFEVLLKLEAVRPRGLRMSDLADRVYLTPSGLSRLVDRMQDRGLVQRDTDAADQRASRLTVTAQGLRLFRRAASSHRQRVRDGFLRQLTPEQQAVLAAVWRQLSVTASR